MKDAENIRIITSIYAKLFNANDESLFHKVIREISDMRIAFSVYFCEKHYYNRNDFKILSPSNEKITKRRKTISTCD